MQEEFRLGHWLAGALAALSLCTPVLAQDAESESEEATETEATETEDASESPETDNEDYFELEQDDFEASQI